MRHQLFQLSKRISVRSGDSNLRPWICIYFSLALLILLVPFTAQSATSWPGDDFPLTPYFRNFPQLSTTARKQVILSWRKGQVKAAIRHYTNAIRNKPKNKKERARLLLAHQLMSFSDAKRALPIYRSLLRSKQNRVSLPARLFLARHHLKQFRARAAFLMVKRWPRNPPSKNLRKVWLAGWLLRGIAAAQSANRIEAHKSYQRLIKKRTIIAGIAAYLQLKSWAKQKRKKKALRASKRYLKRYPRSRFRTKVQLLRAKLLERSKRYRKALRLYRVLTSSRSKSSAWLGIVRCMMRLKKHKQAYRILLRLIRKYPGRWTARSALRTLRRKFRKKLSLSTQYHIAYHLFRRGQFKKSAASLKRLIHKTRKIHKKKRRSSALTILAKSLYLHGRVMFRLKQYRPSRRSLLTYLRLFSRGRYRLSAKLLRIRAQYRLLKNIATVKEYEAFAMKYRSSRLGQKALWWSAQLNFEHLQTSRATFLFNLYYKRYPRSRRRAEARIKIALIAYQQKRYSLVIKRLRPLTRWGGRTGSRALFWTAKAYEKWGKRVLARKYFRKIKPFSESYYAARAKMRTEKRGFLATTPISLYRLLSDAKEERLHARQMRRWLEKRYVGKNANTLAKALKKKRAYRRAYLFALAGLGSSLRAEMLYLQRRTKHPFQLYLLSRAWNAFGNPNRTLYVAGLFRRKTPRSKRKGLPFRALLRLLYPVPFPAAYVSNGKRFGVRALLMVGLTRQESLFNPMIVSHANARGIAQIMPKEAKKMAKKWGLRGFKLRHLFRPQLNLRMGFYHFRAYLKRHSQHVPLTLAAYNAGPGALKRWLKANPGLAKRDLEAFIEYGIGYRETRMYVRYCLRWYNLYRFAFAPNIK